MSDMGSLFSEAKGGWHRRSGLLAALLLALLLLLTIFGHFSLDALKTWQWLVVAVVLLAVFVSWRASNALPKRAKGKIAIVLAVACEGDDEGARLAADFYSELREQLQLDPGGDIIELLALSRHQASRIESQTDAEKVLGDADAQCVVWGDARIRQDAGRASHALRLNAMVTHRPIPKDVSQTFSEEIAAVLPRRISFSQADELVGFMVTAAGVGAAVSYIVGTAALISLQPELAEQFLENAERRLRATPEVARALRGLSGKVPQRLREVYEVRLSRLLGEYVRSGRNGDLGAIPLYVAKLRRVSPRNYRAEIAQAFFHFESNRNVPAAKTALGRCRGEPDATWRVNLAFLYAYEGNLARAEEEYEKGFRLPSHPALFLECESFIDEVLRKEPGQSQLLYCLGLISFFGKRDYVVASEAFRGFLAECSEMMYLPQRLRAEQLLSDCARQLGE